MGKSGLDNFGSDRCDLCGVKFDVGDAKIWTQEIGKAHFYPCYLYFKGDVGGKAEWEKLTKKE